MVEKPKISRPNNVEDLPADLSLTRAKFFNEIFPEIFGATSVAEVTEEDIDRLIKDYEKFLESMGLLNIKTGPERET